MRTDNQTLRSLRQSQRRTTNARPAAPPPTVLQNATTCYNFSIRPARAVANQTHRPAALSEHSESKGQSAPPETYFHPRARIALNCDATKCNQMQHFSRNAKF